MDSMRYEDVTAALRDAYDGSADDRERAERAPWRHRERAAFFHRLAAEGCRTLLEVGAGTGQDSAWFAGQGLDVLATDLSPAMVAYCRAKGLSARVADVLHPGVPAGAFDAVYTVNCLLHVPDTDLPAALCALATTLRPGGLCYLGMYGGRAEEGVWARDWHDPPRFFCFRTDARIRRAAGAVFDLLDFHTLDSGEGLRFQSLTLRRPAGPPDDSSARLPPTEEQLVVVHDEQLQRDTFVRTEQVRCDTTVDSARYGRFGENGQA